MPSWYKQQFFEDVLSEITIFGFPGKAREAREGGPPPGGFVDRTSFWLSLCRSYQNLLSELPQADFSGLGDASHTSISFPREAFGVSVSFFLWSLWPIM